MSGKRHIFSNEFKACDNCRGKGTVYCSSCSGRGYREVSRYSPSGYSETQRDSCSVCHGTGERMCNYCSGTGDQRIYSTTAPEVDEDVIESDSDADEGDFDLEGSKQKYSALYSAKLEETEEQRNKIVEWIWNAHAFSTDYKLSVTSWLAGILLDHPDAAKLLDDAAKQMQQPGLATQVGTLGYQLGSLSGSCSTLQLYKEMTK